MLASAFYSCCNWGWHRCRNVPQIIQLVNRHVSTQTYMCQTIKPLLSTRTLHIGVAESWQVLNQSLPPKENGSTSSLQKGLEKSQYTHVYGPPPNIEGFRDTKNVMIFLLRLGVQNSIVNLRSKVSLIPFFRKHRNESYYTSLQKGGAWLWGVLPAFKWCLWRKKLFSDNNREKNHQIRPGNVTHNLQPKL